MLLYRKREIFIFKYWLIPCRFNITYEVVHLFLMRKSIKTLRKFQLSVIIKNGKTAIKTLP